MTFWRYVFLPLVVLLLGLSVAPPGLRAQELHQSAGALVPAPVGVAAPLLAADPPRVDVIRQAFDLLLDRYVQPLDPVVLLNASYSGVAKGLADAGVAVKGSGPLQLEADREKAWATYISRLNALVSESNPPETFDVTGLAISSMARSVEEGHTAYLSPELYRLMINQLRGEDRYGGIGFRPARPGITVAEVFPGTPAEAAGLRKGDVIRSVDGQSLDEKTLQEVSTLIRGPEGTVVRLQVLRPGSGESFDLEVVRASIKIEYVFTDVIQGDIAYVRVLGFLAPNVADRFNQFIDALPTLGVRGLVIDLRGNTGGRVDLGTRMLNRLIRNGPLMQEERRGGSRNVIQAAGPGWADPLPVAVLIDEGSASMSEIFAAAMRERGLAYVIGKKSAGVVAAAMPFPLSDGSALQVTIMEITSGDGERLNRTGVAPDLEAETSPEDLAQGRDVALEAAVLHLWEQAGSGAATAAAGP